MRGNDPKMRGNDPKKGYKCPKLMSRSHPPHKWRRQDPQIEVQPQKEAQDPHIEIQPLNRWNGTPKMRSRTLKNPK